MAPWLRLKRSIQCIVGSTNHDILESSQNESIHESVSKMIAYGEATEFDRPTHPRLLWSWTGDSVVWKRPQTIKIPDMK